MIPHTVIEAITQTPLGIESIEYELDGYLMANPPKSDFPFFVFRNEEGEAIYVNSVGLVSLKVAVVNRDELTGESAQIEEEEEADKSAPVRPSLQQLLDAMNKSAVTGSPRGGVTL